MLSTIYPITSLHSLWFQKNKMYFRWQICILWLLTCYGLQGVFRWDIKTVLGNGSSQNKSPVSRSDCFREAKDKCFSVSLLFIIFIPSFPLPSFPIACQFFLLWMFPAFSERMFCSRVCRERVWEATFRSLWSLLTLRDLSLWPDFESASVWDFTPFWS